MKVFPPAIYLAGLAVSFLAQWEWPLKIASGTLVPVVRVCGALLLALWLALDTWAIFTIFRSGLSPNPTRPVTALASHGPYRFTRNPMYLSLAFLHAGAGLLANSLWTVLFTIPVLYLVKRLAIDPEEEYLARKFGGEYLEYKQRVRRWL